MSIFMGIDAGTQSIKAELIDVAAGKIIFSEQVHFGKELPDYASPNGFIPAEDKALAHADPLMWVDALEMLLEKLQKSGAPLDKVEGISGSGQQHGSVYLNTSVKPLQKGVPAAEQVRTWLSRPTAPIWMDATTAEECRELNECFGDALQRISGSPAIARFTGPQIRKFYKQEPEKYGQTAVIHLVSSFLCSLLIGADAPIDTGDGAGMNLLDLETLEWNRDFAEFTAPGLPDKLPPCKAGDTVAGNLSDYFVKYGFRAGIPVIVFSGDNPNSLIGVGASAPGTAVISLGTSDTFFAALDEFTVDSAGFGHIFGNPSGGFMSMSCFANGSLAREKIKDALGISWEDFEQKAASCPPGNNGRLMLPYFGPETTPIHAPGVKYNFDPETAKPEEMIRCIMESQALSMRLHTSWVPGEFSVIRVTGGASRSKAFRQILADVFQAEIESIEVVNSAALGAAMRAAEAVGGIPFAELYKVFCRPVERVAPRREYAEIYRKKLDSFKIFEIA